MAKIIDLKTKMVLAELPQTEMSRRSTLGYKIDDPTVVAAVGGQPSKLSIIAHDGIEADVIEGHIAGGILRLEMLAPAKKAEEGA